MARNPGEDLQNPDFSGAVGRAWEMNKNPRGNSPASVGMWLIEAPFVVPAWSYHTANLTTLRDIPGEQPAVVTRPGATHEFVMYALDERFDDRYDPGDINTFEGALLTPPDMVEQLRTDSDERALEIVRFAIQKCVDGELLPDNDYRKDWAAYFRSTEA